MGEFDLIARYFQRPTPRAVLGVGDDCALLAPRPGKQLAVSTDTLVEGRHFLSTVDPEALGHKSLAVNLSDLAACAAEPLAFTLALTLPRADDRFLAGFSRGLLRLADETSIELVGGDTTAGPLSITITVLGEVPAGQALLRSGARVDDEVYVSGDLGDARLALEVFRGTVHLPGEGFDRVRPALERPQPRLALGRALRGVASSAIDLSDGLVGDLGHVLARSQVGARLEWPSIPRSETLRGLPLEWQQRCALSGGDDYELLFTAAPAQRDAVAAAARACGLPVHRIGRIVEPPGLTLIDEAGAPVPLALAGFDHFA
jgi:thiamine-monophosphate kinase